MKKKHGVDGRERCFCSGTQLSLLTSALLGFAPANWAAPPPLPTLPPPAPSSQTMPAGEPAGPADSLTDPGLIQGRANPTYASGQVSPPPPPEPLPEPLGTGPLDERKYRFTKHEISVSGDFLIGQGTITLPVGYSLSRSLGDLPDLVVEAERADRDSEYYGGTISYSFGQAWFLDLSYAHGESSGKQDLSTSLGDLPTRFKIDDEWFQAYIRYTFPKLRGGRFSAYLRAGASYVQADLSMRATTPAGGKYRQNDETEDILGNAGFGVGYLLYARGPFRFYAQAEGEGFYGHRSQDSLENLSDIVGIEFKTAHIDNTLYGGIGRATTGVDYRIGRSACKVFADVGVQARYTFVDYPDTDTSEELLWGPYVKLGLRFNF